jgi:hypothetical protein
LLMLGLVVLSVSAAKSFVMNAVHTSTSLYRLRPTQMGAETVIS